MDLVVRMTSWEPRLSGETSVAVRGAQTAGGQSTAGVLLTRYLEREDDNSECTGRYYEHDH